MRLDPIQFDDTPFEETAYQRGAMFSQTPQIVTGPNGETYTSEETSRRPYVLLGPNPYERMMAGLRQPAVPVSTKMGYKSIRVTIQQGDGPKSAVADMATTIDSPDIGSYCGILGIDSLTALSKALAKVFRLDESWEPGLAGAPGSIVTVPWNPSRDRRMLIVGSAHMTNMFSPVLAAPVDLLDMADGKVTGVELKPLAFARMKKGRYEGNLGLDDMRLVQAAARESYGLT